MSYGYRGARTFRDNPATRSTLRGLKVLGKCVSLACTSVLSSSPIVRPDSSARKTRSPLPNIELMMVSQPASAACISLS
jgi:hypothetical protein